MAARLLDRNRLMRLSRLSAYMSGRPPMPYLTRSDRKGFYELHRIARSNFARKVVQAPAERMSIRSIRTAAENDDNGDKVAWRYWTANGLDIDFPDVLNDMLGLSEGYIRVGLDDAGKPIALKRDPRYIITAQDPLNPRRTIAAFELVWDEWTGTDYAYLWLYGGKQYVASRERKGRPRFVTVPGTDIPGRDWTWGRPGYFQLSFDAAGFTMRPQIDEVDPADRDGGPYSQTYAEQRVPVVLFPNRDGVGEFEEHMDLIDRINQDTMMRIVTAAIQAYKQRALKQALGPNGEAVDRLPKNDPNTQQPINWNELFEPGPDALWKMPPGVEIWESTEVQLGPLMSAETDDIKKLSFLTSTPLSAISDDVNQSAEGAQLRREGLVFKVEDRNRIAGRCAAEVISLLFAFAPDEDRYDAENNDRSDPGSIVIDWNPAERFSLAEKAGADSLNKSLSTDMAASKIWGLTPDEVEINRAQRAAEALLAQPVPVTGGNVPAA